MSEPLTVESVERLRRAWTGVTHHTNPAADVVHDLIATIDALRSRLDEERDGMSIVRGQLATNRVKLAAAEAERNDLGAALADVRSERDAFIVRMERAEAKLAAAERERDEAEEVAGRFHALIEKLRAKRDAGAISPTETPGE